MGLDNAESLTDGSQLLRLKVLLLVAVTQKRVNISLTRQLAVVYALCLSNAFPRATW